MAKRNSLPDDGIIDLTELIEPGSAGGKAAEAYAKAAVAENPQDDDFGSILADISEPAAKSDRKVDPNESLDMSGMGGIDNLLESLDIPPQPRESAKKDAPEPPSDELDSVLDDLLVPDSQKSGTAQAPEPAETEVAADLDAMFEDAPAPAATPKSDLDADLDDILASFDEPAPKSPAKPAEPPKKSEPDIAADLDDILGELDAPAAPEPPQPAAEQSVEPEQPAVEQRHAQADAVKDSFDASSASLQQPADMDDILGDLDAAAGFNDARPAAPAAPLEYAQGGPATPEGVQAPAHSRSTLPAEVSDREGHLQPVTLQPWPADMIAGICQGIASAQNNDDREAMQEFSRELGAQSAHVQDMGGQLSQLGKRLLACESKLAAARARIAALEKGLEAAAALEDLLHAGTPLHNGFMALITTAVGNALKSYTPPAVNAEVLKALEEKFESRLAALSDRLAPLEKNAGADNASNSLGDQMEKLDARVWQMDVRMEALENKVASLTHTFDVDMEKVAAQTVAKLLHEEITKLMQE